MSKKKNRARAQDKLQQIAPGIIDNKPDIISVKKALDAYSNVPANLGIGSSNLAQAGRYVMERFTWDYWTLNVLYRNNWIAKAIIDKPANGLEYSHKLIRIRLQKYNKFGQGRKQKRSFCSA